MVRIRVAYVGLIVLVGLYVIVTTIDNGTKENVKWLKNGTFVSLNDSEYVIPTDAFDLCVLRVYEPFYKEMKRILKYKEPLKGCNQNFTLLTELIDGAVRIHPRRAKEFNGCSASCLHYVTDQEAEPGAWRNITRNESFTMDCDFIWTKCYQANVEVDQGLHMQIKEVEEQTSAEKAPRSTTEKTEKPTKASGEAQRRPNVYIIVVDAVSSTQVLRSLPKTINFLKKNMSGVFFHHLNKIGDNSAPNGYAMTMGWRIEDMDRSVVGAPNLKAEYDWDTVCNKYRDNDSSVLKDYQRAGYKTLISEDYPGGTMYSWPSCLGFQHQPSTHSFRSFVAMHSKEQLLQANFNSSNCFELARETISYTGMFMKAYEDKPKFGLTWAVTISHDDTDLLFHQDDYFENFFQDNEPYLRNSFVFFMSDHGMRWGGTYDTELGKRETKNPFLLVTVPEFLRTNNKFMETLEENSMKLLTQFDVHATFVDLLKVAPESNFNDFSFETIFEDNPNNATSILRPLGPFRRRNCKNIPVPFQYCLCEFDLEPIDNPDMAKTAHKLLTAEINQILITNNLTGFCHLLTPDRVIDFQAFAPEYPNRLYELLFSVTPGGGQFKAMIHYDEPGKRFRLKGEIERRNEYGSTAACLDLMEKPTLKWYCYCLVLD